MPLGTPAQFGSSPHVAATARKKRVPAAMGGASTSLQSRIASLTPETESARARVAANPRDAAGHYALAQALERAGDVDGALAALAAATGIEPAFFEAHHLTGILRAQRGDARSAVESFRRALAIQPRYARAHNNLGNVLKSLGRLAEAEAAFAEAARLQPDYALAHHNLGALRQARGDSAGALVALEAAVALRPQFRPTWVALAAARRQAGRLDDAIAALRHAIALDPEQSTDERIALGATLAECGMAGAARAAYADVLREKPDHLPAAIGFHLTLPQGYESDEAIDVARAQFASGLNAIERDFQALHARLDADAALDAWRWSNFFLAYQGRDDRALQERYARLVARAIDAKAPELRRPVARERDADPLPTAALPLPPDDASRIRVGFVSAFFVDGTVGHYFARWITMLPRAEFDVVVYHLAPHVDDVTRAIAARADRFVDGSTLGASVGPVARALRAEALDVLVYPELGMDPRCMALAAMRLVPVQVAGWGHPVTTGHDTIDHFLTAGAMEPDGADAHYSERLVRLPGVGTSYPRPAVDRAARERVRAELRARLGVAPDTPVYLCPQALFKLLPADDALFARVLEAAPASVLVLFAARHPALTNATMHRLSRALEARGLDARRRLRVLSRLPRADFLAVTAACDAMLDATAWSGGNTSLDALAAGLPIVTLPGAFMRGRQSMAMLRLCGVDELVAADADDYVRIAARLAQDRAWRAEVAQRIDAGSARLFDDAQPLAAFAQLMRDARSRAPRSAPPPTSG
jgi:predicted O-linked N-acetylglucosamine transferase (SPINDLY family)